MEIEENSVWGTGVSEAPTARPVLLEIAMLWGVAGGPGS